MSDYQIGMVCAITQNIVGYPLDTIKVRFQTVSPIRPTTNIFQGIAGPLVCNVLTTGINYGIFNDLQNCFQNSIASGFISGLLLSPIVNVGENYKISRQLSQIPPPSFRMSAYVSRGLGLCTLRESVGCATYFGLYNNLSNSSTYSSPFLFGGLAGVGSWLITYPIDTLKTRLQSNSNCTLWSAYGQGHLFRGMTICLVRAFIVNACSFVVYDSLKNKKK